MALEGNLNDFSATEILQLVASQRKTGCLVVSHESRRMSVFVLDGRIVSTRSGQALADDPLYRFLRRTRRLSEDQLSGIAGLQAESGRDLEDLIVQGRYLEAEELGGILERQVLTDLTELIEWTLGSYQFDPERRWPRPILVRLSIEASLIEAARRADERKRFQELFRDGRQIVSVRDLPDPEEEIADEESELFGIIDGQHTVSEVVSLAPLTDYEACEALQRMIEAGWVEFLGRREEAPAPGTSASHTPAATVQRPASAPIAREAAVAGFALACLTGLWFLGQTLTLPPRPATAGSAFAAAQVQDVRLALEVYRRERGEYPNGLEDLVREQALDRGQLVIEGRPLHYRPDPRREAYHLVLPPRP